MNLEMCYSLLISQHQHWAFNREMSPSAPDSLVKSGVMLGKALSNT